MIDVAEALAALPAKIPRLHMIGLRTTTAQTWPWIAEVVQMLASPPEGDLQKVMEVSEGGVAMDEQAAPDERADTSQNNAPVIKKWEAV